MRCARTRIRLTVIAMLPVAFIAVACAPTTPTPPGPPIAGPGSAANVASDVRTTAAGAGGQQVFIYEPAGTALASAPVIVFLHGYSAVNPRVYGAWIKHLVQRGNIVIYPVYQDSLLAPVNYTPNAVAAVQNAFGILRGGGHIPPDETHFAVVGHSLGTVIGMNLAAVGHRLGLPKVRALMVANAGDVNTKLPSAPSIQTGNYNQIPADMLFLGVVGADDTMVGQDTTLSFWEVLTQIPLENREVLELFTDDHGEPALEATHRAPVAFDGAFDSSQSLIAPDWVGSLTGTLNALDDYGYWKWLDALTDAAFYGTNREYALGNTPEQTFMGLWSDGQPVIPAARLRPAY